MNYCKPLWVFGLLALSSPCFGEFRVSPTTVPTAEGGAMNVLMIQSGQGRFALRQPPGYTLRVEPQNNTVVFRSPDEKTVISFQVTTDSPGLLPSEDALRSKVTAQTPGAAILQSSVCASGYKPGRFFDLVRAVREGMSVRFRHAYVPSPEGMVEFVFATDSLDFEQKRATFNSVLNSLRVDLPTVPLVQSQR